MPTTIVVNGVPLITGGVFAGGAVTVIVNAARLADSVPSLTLMEIPEKSPLIEAPGVPDNLPVDVLNDAHAGRLLILNVSESPSASVAVGRNEYALPASTVVAGIPDICGALLPTTTG